MWLITSPPPPQALARDREISAPHNSFSRPSLNCSVMLCSSLSLLHGHRRECAGAAAEEADVVSEDVGKQGQMNSWGNEIGIMKERVVCGMDGDHLPNEEVEKKTLAVPHIPRKEERMWESKNM